MAEIYVESSSLRTQAEELGSLNEQFRGQVETLQETESALNGMWEGTSREAFHDAFTSDVGQMNVFYNVILAYVHQLEQIVSAYERIEQTNAEIARTRSCG